MNDLELIFAKYKQNITKSKELDKQLYERHDEETSESLFLKNQSVKNSIFAENRKIIKEISELLSRPLTESVANTLYEQSILMYQNDYDDAQFLIEIFKALEAYYEQNKDIDRLISIYVAHSYELNGIQSRQAFTDRMNPSVLEKVLAYKSQYYHLNQSCRLAFWKAVYNYVIVGLDRGNWTLTRCFELYEEYLTFFDECISFENDDENPQFKRLYEVFKNNIVFCILRIDEETPELAQKFKLYVDKIIQQELNQASEIGAASGATYAASLYSNYLKGDETLDSMFDKYYEYFQNKNQILQKKEAINEEELNFYISGISFLRNLSKFEMHSEKTKKLKGLLKAITEYHWNLENDGSLLKVLDLNRLLSSSIISLSTNPDEIENCFMELNIKKNFLSYVHSRHVADLSVMIYEECMKQNPVIFEQYSDMTDEYITSYIRKCGLFHDLGSIATSFLHFYSYRPLYPDEMQMIYSNPLAAAPDIEENPEMAEYIEVLLGHHKSYDGKSGFPIDYDNTMASNKLIVDLIHIADTIDISFNPLLSHGQGISFENLLSELNNASGTLYHPEIVKVLVESKPLQIKIRKEIENNHESIKEYFKTVESIFAYQSIDEFLTQVEEKFQIAVKTDHYDELTPYLDKLFSLAAKEYSNTLLGIAYYYSMFVRKHNGELSEAVYAGTECVRYLEQSDEVRKCCTVYNMLGALMETLGNHENSLEYYLLCVQKAKECPDKKDSIEFSAYNNIANMMKNACLYDRAIYYYSYAESLEIEEEEYLLAMGCNILYCYIKIQDDEKIRLYEEKVLKLMEHHNEFVFLTSVYLAYLYEYYQNYELMDHYLERAVSEKNYIQEYMQYIDEIHLYLDLLEKLERYELVEDTILQYLDFFHGNSISFGEMQNFLQQRARCARKRGDMAVLMDTLDRLEENVQRNKQEYTVRIRQQEQSFLELAEKKTKQNQILKDKERLEVEVKEAWDANQAKSTFLSSMSHEIRTPIHAILGLDEMILRECKDEGILEYAKDIETAGKTLLGLINDVLDFSKMEAGKLEILPEEYDTAEMILDLKNMIQPRAADKNLKFNVHCESNVPKKLYGDDLRVKQIVINILTNAVKYTKEGQVDFSIKNLQKGREGFCLCLSVKDTGMGMKEEDLEKLYKPFERIEEKRNRNIEGTGLGMSIVTSLIKQMNGELKVTSEYGKGSEFVVILPQKVVDSTGIGDLFERKKTPITKTQALFTAPEAEILVVDDNAVNIKVVTSLLKRTAVKVTTATSGQECIDICKEKQFHLILLDHRMPEMDGVETLEHLRTDNLIGQTPVIALTANAISAALDYYRSVGFNDLLTKPVNVSEMERKIMMYLPKELVE